MRPFGRSLWCPKNEAVPYGVRKMRPLGRSLWCPKNEAVPYVRKMRPFRRFMAETGESEKLIGIEVDKALVTLVTCEASKLRRIASYRGKRDIDVSRERSE